MIQTQTFALDKDTRARLLSISAAIARHKDDRAAVIKLIAEHDEIMKQAQTKIYDPHAEARWA
jgi:hypothetical protein